MTDKSSQPDGGTPHIGVPAPPSRGRALFRRVAGAKVPLVVFLIVSGGLATTLMWWAFLQSPGDISSQGRSSTSTSTLPSGAVDVPSGYSRVELTNAASIPDVGTSGWICTESRYPTLYGPTCFVPDGKPLPAGATAVTTAPGSLAAPPPESGGGGDWVNKAVALAGAAAVLLTALSGLGWQPFRKGTPPSHSG